MWIELGLMERLKLTKILPKRAHALWMYFLRFSSSVAAIYLEGAYEDYMRRLNRARLMGGIEA